MKQLVIYLSIFSVLLFTCSCTYRSSLQQNTFNDLCTNQKIPMKIGIVASQSLKKSVAKTTWGGYNFEVRVDETLQKSIYDLFACYFTQVTMVTDASKFEGLDALVYCDYSATGLNTLLKITIKESRNDFVIADYRQEGQIAYSEPIWAQLEGGATLGLATPIITQQLGEIYKDALLNSMATSISQINVKMRLDRRVKGIKRFDTAKLKLGMTASELRNYYGSIKETTLNDPFTSNIKYDLIVFEALPSLSSNEVNTDGPFTAWAMFHNDQAIVFGIGKEKEAEHSIYSALVNQKYALGKLKQSQAERLIFDNFRKLYGEPEPISIVDPKIWTV